MKKIDNKLESEIVFLVKKLPAVKKLEALDFIKWLWVKERPAKAFKINYEKLINKIWHRVEKEPISEKEIDRIVEDVRAERYAKSGN